MQRSTTASESITTRSVDSRGILRVILEDLVQPRSSSDMLLLLYGMQSSQQIQSLISSNSELVRTNESLYITVPLYNQNSIVSLALEPIVVL